MLGGGLAGLCAHREPARTADCRTVVPVEEAGVPLLGWKPSGCIACFLYVLRQGDTIACPRDAVAGAGTWWIERQFLSSGARRSS